MSFSWAPEQLRRLEAFGVPRAVDVHCHVLPGLDDGPENLAASVEHSRALVADGITTVVATPHQLGSYHRDNSLEVIKDGIARLAAELQEHEIPLEVLPGGDVRIDERLMKLLDAGEIATVADVGKHVLLELPHRGFIDPLPIIELLREKGVTGIMTHPERHRYLRGSLELPRTWVEEGAMIQVTAGSLLGDFGRRAVDHAWGLIEAGLVDIVATDAHDAERRPPRMTAALEALTEEIGKEEAGRMCVENPGKIVESRV